MPKRYRGLVHLPAKIDELAAAQRREIDKPEIQVFDDAAVLLYRVDRLKQLGLKIMGLAVAQRRDMAAGAIRI